MKSLRYAGLLVNTTPGLEDVTAGEVSEILKDVRITLKIRPYGLQGKVLAQGDLTPDHGHILVRRSRSAERVILLLGLSRIGRLMQDLEALYKFSYSLPFEGMITPFSRVAVRAQREGRHEYTSLDVARVVGQAILDKIKGVYGIRPAVDLRSPTIVIYAEVVGENVLLGIDLAKGVGLHERGYRAFVHPAALRPTVAYALLRVSGIREGDMILDPMCGSGTILIEAALAFKRVRLYGMDINEEYLKGAMKSARKAGVGHRILFKVGNARYLEEEFPNADFDRVITNPPYGVRMRPRDIKSLYRGLIRGSYNILKEGGSLTLLTTRHRLAKRIANEVGFSLAHERSIYLGGLYPRVLVFSK